jgi:hypothetical protein
MTDRPIDRESPSAERCCTHCGMPETHWNHDARNRETHHYFTFVLPVDDSPAKKKLTTLMMLGTMFRERNGR